MTDTDVPDPYEAAAREADAAARELIDRYPALRGVAVVLDWAGTGNAESAYTGAWVTRTPFRVAAEAVGMTQQLAAMLRMTVDTTDDKLTVGPIALQYGAGRVMFRNVRIRAY